MNRIAKLFVVNAVLWLATTANAACPPGFNGLSPVPTCVAGSWVAAVPSQSVSAADTLDLTGIPNTFSTLFVDCILSSSASSANPLLFFYGTSSPVQWFAGGPAYEWRNDVRWTGDANNGSSVGQGLIDASYTNVGMNDSGEVQLISGNIANVLPVTLQMWITNYATPADNNTAIFFGSFWRGFEPVSGANNGRDWVEGTLHGAVTSPITGLRWQFGGGTKVTGTCSASGLVQ